ncbi:GNAT family N-acetyltransferase [Levilactobacillus brevis]|uniref:GNAT family N-acetyltransferase n=1 Tax=Levilactobacillus brevis TaxID=1580 RepID=A0AA41JU49_LEVBR|nr:GNAT family N-acetyltransferase [Levilactobacillus brevis]ANN47994.1 GNAT family acetyltransferase [Levilactobacillus brevis]KID43852.1 Acetyltransferase, GNAT family [Levilactobacillus brevis]MBS0948534.1 GNAT family N-acetyltransferase [Levilactobacillus brevis]MBS0979054.1 GNAT family N-acetyltransferase [Levilactobacillus brevis]MBS1011722.1 GNAT family N-acetyltransferase [Levilactobacillus brevis]
MTLTHHYLRASNAAAAAQLIATTLLTTNQKDYTADYLTATIAKLQPQDLVDKATWTHFYVFYEGTELVGTGAIGSYWGKADEASLFDIFVSPEYQGKGIGRAIVTTLEQDAFFKTAKRVEIPASITALGFYEKLGYQPKNHQTHPDNEQLFRLEKFTGVSPK